MRLFAIVCVSSNAAQSKKHNHLDAFCGDMVHIDIASMLISQGIEPHPGPNVLTRVDAESRGAVLIDVVNITNLERYQDELLSFDAHIVHFQEHSLVQRRTSMADSFFTKNG